MELEFLGFEPSFLDHSWAWRNQNTTQNNNPVDSISRDELLKRHLSEGSNLKDLGNYDKFRWFVSLNGELAGMVSLRSINLYGNIAELGYGVGESFQGKGIGTASVKKLLDKVFNETPIRRITAHVFDKNLASVAVMKKLGFVQEGVLREHHIINGQPEDALLFAILKKDWVDEN